MAALRLFALLLAGSLLLAACASGPSRLERINANRDAYNTWPLEYREAIVAGQAIPGMTREMVRMALGEPAEIIRRSTPNGEEEAWVYQKKDYDAGAPSMTIGGPGGTPVTAAGPAGALPPPIIESQGEVLFRNGQVIRANADTNQRY